MLILTVELKLIVHVSDEFEVDRELSLDFTVSNKDILVG